MKRVFLALICSCLALPVVAQEDALKDLPGYVDFGEMTQIYGEAKVNISIGGALLSFVGAMAKNSDPDVAAIFSKLKGVRVSVYSTEDAGADAALDRVSKVKSWLIESNWEPVVQVNDDGEQVQIFMNMKGGIMHGLTLMAVDDEEAVFINVIGQLDPNELSKVMNNFNIDLGDAMDIDVD